MDKFPNDFTPELINKKNDLEFDTHVIKLSTKVLDNIGERVDLDTFSILYNKTSINSVINTIFFDTIMEEIDSSIFTNKVAVFKVYSMYNEEEDNYNGIIKSISLRLLTKEEDDNEIENDKKRLREEICNYFEYPKNKSPFEIKMSDKYRKKSLNLIVKELQSLGWKVSVVDHWNCIDDNYSIPDFTLE